MKLYKHGVSRVETCSRAIRNRCAILDKYNKIYKMHSMLYYIKLKKNMFMAWASKI